MKLKAALLIAPLLLGSFASPASARVPRERILFASFDGFSTGVRSIKPNGDDRRTLTEGPHINPRWSPDRTKIAFERARKAHITALLVADKDGSNLRRLVEFTRDFYKEGFAWSPDGTKIVYAAAPDLASGSTHDIFVVDVASGESTRLTEGSGDEYEPVWSPDGTKIAYTTETPGSGPDPVPSVDIAAMSADGSNQTVLTEHAHADHSPQWSPDGSLISFISERDDENANNPDVGASFSEIYVMGPAGENERRVTDHTVLKDQYEWSPDGMRFAYLGRCDIDVCNDRETDVYAIDLDGSARVNLTSDARFEATEEVEWSPNSRWVAYVWEQRGGRSQDLMLVRADGSHTIKRVTDTPRRGEGDLDW